MEFRDVPTSLAWEFTHLIPGTFKRNKAQFAHHDYPILAPLPSRAAATRPMEAAQEVGPFLYFVVDDKDALCYIGKSKEEHVLKRWIRPGNGGPATHYWTHSTKGGGCVFNIAQGLRQGRRYQLRFASLPQLRDANLVPHDCNLAESETNLIRALRPAWNGY